MESKVERFFRSYYTEKTCSGMSTVFTPKEVRDKMTVHAEPGMKILVLFNFEFCYDLWKMGHRDVTFASDDELRNDIAKETWGYRTELIDPRSINKTFENMKFDLIISNPPYNQNLDLIILKNVYDLSKRLCFVHPATWLLDNKNINKTYVECKRLVEKDLYDFEIFNANNVFNVYTFSMCGITHIEKKCNKLNIDEISLHGISLTFMSSKDKILSRCKIDNLLNYLKYTSYTKPISKDLPYDVGFSGMGCDMNRDDRYVIIRKGVEHKSVNEYSEYRNKPQSCIFEFSEISYAINFKNYLKTKFARFCLSIFKFNQQLGRGELGSIPWFDFSRSWSDEECAKELGITNEELLWMIQQIPDYYPEDAEIYRKLERKLENLS